MPLIEQLRKDKKRYSKSNLKEVANICNLLGKEYQDIGDYDSALEEHREEAKIFESLNDLIGVAVAYRRMGEVYCELHNWSEALSHQNKHLSLAKEVNNSVERQRAYATIGRTYMQVAEDLPGNENRDKRLAALQSCQTAFFKALDACDDICDKVDSTELAQMRARLYHNIGLVLDLKEDVSGALKFILQALELCKSYQLVEDTFRAYSELSKIHLKLESITQSLTEAQITLQMAKKLQNKRFIIETHQLIAQIHLYNNNFIAARKSWYKAFKLRYPTQDVKDEIEKNLKKVVSLCIHQEELSKLETNVETRLNAFDKMGDILCSFSLFKQAIVFYQKRLELALETGKGPSFLAPIYTSLAQTYKDSGQLDKALEYFQKELDIHLANNPKEAAMTLIEMAQVCELGHLHNESDSAPIFYERALQIATEANSPPLKAIVLRHCASSTDLLNTRKEAFKSELEHLEGIHGSDIGYEESEEDEDEDDINLDLIEFSDSDEEENTLHSRPTRMSFRPKVNATGETPLHTAAIKGNVSMVRRLLDQNHPVNVRDNSGWLPIHEACNWGHRDVAELLINAGSWLNDRGGKECSGTTPLHDAAVNGHFHVIELLLENNAKVLVKDDNGNTPLHCLANFSNSNDDYDLEQCRQLQAILVERMERAGYLVSPKLKIPLAPKGHEENLVWDTGSRKRKTMSATRDRVEEIAEEEDNESFDLPPSLVKEDDGPILPWECTSKTKSSATHDYKMAIKSLGSLSRKLDSSHQQASSSCPSKISSKIPLIPEKDYVNEDWLIDDIDSVARKRKCTDPFDGRCKEKSRRKMSPDQFFPKKVKQTKLTSIISKNSSRKKFSDDDDDLRVKSDEPIFIDAPSTNERVDNPAHITPISQFSRASYISPKTSIASTSPLRFHIKVLGKKLLVPVAPAARKNTIRWLEGEVSRRYSQLMGVKPHLRLSTVQDEILNPDDTLDLALFADNIELRATVLGIRDLPSLPERYSQICHDSSVPLLPDVSALMTDCLSSCELNLGSIFLRDDRDLTAIFSSLHHQNIQVLKLNSCRIQDTLMSSLIQCIPNLSLLRILELEACALSTDSLDALCDLLNQERDISLKLLHLNLSYNEFSKAKFSHFKSLLSFPLHVLKLRSCGISINSADSSSPTHSSICSRLQTLDLAENKFSLRTLSSLILACPYLTNLSLSNCISRPRMNHSHPLNPATTHTDESLSLGVSLSSLLGSGSECPLESLDISSCNVSNSDLNTLISYLYRCSPLTTLNLSRNPLSAATVTTLLQEVDSTRNISLKELHLHGIKSLSKDSTFLENLSQTIARKSNSAHPFVAVSLPRSDLTQQLTRTWLSLYDGRASVKTLSKAIFLTVHC